MNFLGQVKVGKSYIKYSLPISNINLIRWYPKARTDIHDHDGKRCDFIILNGSLHEQRYLTKDRHTYYRGQKLRPFIINTITDEEGFHQIFNFENKVKWSLHRYL
jgi:hypothetical protein